MAVNCVIAAYIHDQVMLMKAMSASAKPKRRAARRPLLPPKPYHHGDLKRVLIDAALGLVEESARLPAAPEYRPARRSGIFRAASRC